jgi:hypothetical protein
MVYKLIKLSKFKYSWIYLITVHFTSYTEYFYQDKARGVNRDVFSLTMDGFDTHFDLKNVLNQKLTEIGAALKSFR